MNPPGIPDGVKVISVGELTRGVKKLLEDAFRNVWVSGEISNLSKPASGHLYFTLKDTEAALRGVMWRGVALRLRFDLKDGMAVIVRGQVSVYPPRGDYQIIIEELHPKGIGAQELALRQLKEKLFRLGYFDPGRKKPLPRFPRRLALVTSPTGAAVRDMLEILGKRWPGAEVWVCPAKMQGEGAAFEIAGAIRRANRLRFDDGQRIDVLLVGRGGGSVEDLWAFNEEVVAQAIYESAIPVVSAVGHETDVSVADMVADYRALTPSQAAVAATPNRIELLEGLHAYEDRLRAGLLQLLDNRRRELNDLAARRAFRQPLERVRAAEQRMDEWGERLRRAADNRLRFSKKRLEALAGKLEALSPLNVLSRGYSLTRIIADRTVVRDARQVQPGDRLVTILQKGQVVSRVEEVADAPEWFAVQPGNPGAGRTPS
ncbi:MAG: exodeoxyribonuclease VII large subunit [Planctomycetia bacterium]|nr:exodeoxyribonuclease VII large subunit [Planctomycetia bacterium]